MADFDLDVERRAWQLLQWTPFSLPSEFEEDLAFWGHYSKLQQQRSDLALNQWDEAHKPLTSPELSAFLELEAKGIYSQSIFFSPSKAADGYYTARLKQLNEQATRSHRSSRSFAAYRRSRSRRGLT